MSSNPDRGMDDMDAALNVAHRSAVEWLRSLPERGVPPRMGAEDIEAALGVDSPRSPPRG